MNYYNSNYPNYYQTNPYMTPGLNGKLVDTIDMVKAAEVPLGGYGIFPKADLSEVYIKTWNQNGTTSIITFKPMAPIVANESAEPAGLTELMGRIDELNQKIDLLIPKKGVSANDY